MANQYVLGKGNDTITIISNRPASKVGKNQITLPPDLKIKYGNRKLVYWEGTWLSEGYWAIRVIPGRPYQHTFEIVRGKVAVKISSKDQKTFYVEI